MERKNLLNVSVAVGILMFFTMFTSVLGQCKSEVFPFLTEDIMKATQKRYDYIVVGGGSSGCPLAATLSKYYEVLLVERGGSPFCVENSETMPGMLWSLKHGYNEVKAVAEFFTSEDGVPNARGKVLGGGTALNMGFYTRASKEFITMMGLDEKLVEDAYKWEEQLVAHRPKLKEWQVMVRNAMLEAQIGPYNGYSFDHVVGTKVGGSLFDWKDIRHSSAELLGYSNRDNIVVLLNTTATRILFSPPPTGLDKEGALKQPKVSGVQLMDPRGVMRNAMLKPKGELFLSAGALGSPQLLMLSGIGPSLDLQKLGVPVVRDLPGVGQGMADNPRHDVGIFSQSPIEPSTVQTVGITDTGNFIEAFSLILMLPNTTEKPKRHAYVGKIFTKTNGPFSTGSMKLKSTDPLDIPSVRFNYLSDPLDMEHCVSGIRHLYNIVKSPTMSILNIQNDTGVEIDSQKVVNVKDMDEVAEFMGEPLPINVKDDRSAAERYCRETVKTIWHYHGGCILGSVVDKDFRVMGVDSLRVVDTSTVNFTPGANPQATIMMLGRYVGVKITQARLDLDAPVGMSNTTSHSVM